MRMDTIGQRLGTDVFLLVHHGDFCGWYWLRTAEDPFGHTIGWELKPHQGPKPVPMPDILFSVSLGTPHCAATMPKEGTRSSLGPDTCCKC